MDFEIFRLLVENRLNRDTLGDAWFEGEPLSAELQSRPLAPDDETPGFALYYRTTGLPVLCHLCHKNGGWQPEGASPHVVFVCEHGLNEYFPIPQISTVRADEVYTEGGNVITA